MSIVRQAVGFALILLVSAGCRSSDPLARTWSNDTCYGMDSMPGDVESCELRLIFTDSLEISMEADAVSLPATANNPGCITTKKVTGQTWSTRSSSDRDVLTVEGNATATEERNDCVNADDEMDPVGTSNFEIPSGEIEYEISDNELTVYTTELSGTYSP